MAVMDKNNVSVGNGNVLTVISVVIAVLGGFFGISYQINTLHEKIDAIQSEIGKIRAEMKSEFGKIHADIAEFRSESSGTESHLPNVEKGL